MSGPESLKPDDQLLDEFLAGQGAVRETYRAMAQEKAPAHLDAAILHDAAQAAARPLPRPRRSRWQTPMAAAAVMVLSFGVFLQVQRDPVVQKQIMAVPDQAAPAAAPAPLEATPDAAKAEVLADAAPEREEAEAEKKQAAAGAARPKPAPLVEKRRASPALVAPPPAPPAPVMADVPSPSSLAAASPAPEIAAMETEPAASAAVAAAAARASVQRQQHGAAAVAPKAKASRSPGNAAAFAAPAAAPPERDFSAEAQPADALLECPAPESGQAPVVTTAAAAIALATPLLIQRFTAELIARYEPLQGERHGPRWQVFGTPAAGVVGGVPEAEVCASTGTVLRIRHTQ